MNHQSDTAEKIIMIITSRKFRGLLLFFADIVSGCVGALIEIRMIHLKISGWCKAKFQFFKSIISGM